MTVAAETAGAAGAAGWKFIGGLAGAAYAAGFNTGVAGNQSAGNLYGQAAQIQASGNSSSLMGLGQLAGAGAAATGITHAGTITADPLLTSTYGPRSGSPLLTQGADLGPRRDVRGVQGRKFIGAYAAATFRGRA